MGAMKERMLRGATRDLPAGVVSYGNPARVVREIGARDPVVLP